MPSESPDPAEFNEDGVADIAVDGRVIARLADIDDLSKSPADEAAAIATLRSVLDDSAEEFEDETGSLPPKRSRGPNRTSNWATRRGAGIRSR